MERKTYLYDAKGKVLGRMSTEIARILSGRDRVDYTPHIDAGARVVVINAQNVAVTGNKEHDKTYYRFSGYHGGITATTLKQQREKDASKIIMGAVKGMLPKNKLASAMLARLFIYNSDEHKHQITEGCER
jgi:large subunit ribosomal protein L13